MPVHDAAVISELTREPGYHGLPGLLGNNRIRPLDLFIFNLHDTLYNIYKAGIYKVLFKLIKYSCMD